MTVRPTVLSIAGLGRSGSTLLERMLGSLPGVAAVGEVVHLAERGLIEDQCCGCGAPFGECGFWQAVGDTGFGGWAGVDASEVHALARSVDRHRYLAALVAPRGRFRVRLDRYVAHLDALYGAIASVSGARVIVDSSKHPSHSYVLRHAGRVDLRVVLLVRDPRGVAGSWQKRVARPEVRDREQLMPRYAPCRVALRWDTWNLLVQGLERLRVPVLRLRYEDLVADPGERLRQVAAFAGLESVAGDFAFLQPAGSDEAASAQLAVIHSVAGNPMRFARGPVPITLDDAWRQALPARQRAAVSLLTSPLRHHYGYAGNGS